MAVESPARIWVTLPAQNSIALVTVTPGGGADVLVYGLPTPGGYPNDIAYAAGAVWITERDGNKLARFDPVAESWVEYPLLTAGSRPSGLDVVRGCSHDRLGRAARVGQGRPVDGAGGRRVGAGGVFIVPDRVAAPPRTWRPWRRITPRSPLPATRLYTALVIDSTVVINRPSPPDGSGRPFGGAPWNIALDPLGRTWFTDRAYAGKVAPAQPPGNYVMRFVTGTLGTRGRLPAAASAQRSVCGRLLGRLCVVHRA